MTQNQTSLQFYWILIKRTGQKWLDDKASRLGAALAFYSMLSIGPLLLIAVSITGVIFGQEAASGHIMEQTKKLIGNQATEIIKTMLANSQESHTGILGTIMGMITLLIGASGVFWQLQDALNTIWNAKPNSGRIINIIKRRFFSFALVFSAGCLLMLSLLITVVMTALEHYLVNFLPSFSLIIISFVINFGVVTTLFAIIYKVLPDVIIHWKDVWLGAFITAMLFDIGKFLIGIYLSYSALSSAYGAAGSLVVLLVWVYYSAQIFLFGAEFTQVHALYRRS